MRLEGKVAIITGAASGYGKGSAEMFAREGARVAAADINAEELQEVVDGINRAGGEAVAIRTDISKADDARKMVEETLAKFGRLNVLFNNAGIEHMGLIHEVTEGEWDRIMDVNLKGTWLCSKYAIPHLIEAGGGSMVHTASLSALKGRTGNACYGASKAGVLAMSQIMAVELAPQKVRSNCICPVVATTPMGERFLQRAMKIYGMDAGADWDFEAAKQMAATTVPMQMLSEPDDIAYAAVYLASDESRLVTGTYITVDGGSRAA
jgi:NAD(P)-dependent dehydrogenase (short-subunit alcohol dehydrogenase family)